MYHFSIIELELFVTQMSIIGISTRMNCRSNEIVLPELESFVTQMTVIDIVTPTNGHSRDIDYLLSLKLLFIPQISCYGSANMRESQSSI